jgi:hypothetical protein
LSPPVEHLFNSHAGFIHNQQGSHVQVRNAAVLEELVPEVDMGIPLGAAEGQMEPVADEHEEDDLEVLPAKPDGFPRCCRKAVVPHDVTLLCRSARIETKNKGFNPNSASASNTASPAPLAKGKKNKGKSVVTSMMEATAYEGHNVLGAPPAPHLSVTNVQAIGVGFCKMSAESVSGEALKASDNARNKNQN